MRYGLKERLLGALVLIALAVIFLPWLLEEERAQAPVAERIITPEPPPAVTLTEPATQPPTLTLPWSTAEQAQIQTTAETEDTETASPAASPASGLSLDPSGGAQAWAIQVATFAERDNARRLIRQLDELGFRPYRRKNGELSVVLIGPYLDQNQARTDQDRLMQMQGFNTLLLRYVPEYLARERGQMPESPEDDY